MRNAITVYAHCSLPFMRNTDPLFQLIHTPLAEPLSTGGTPQLGNVGQ